MRPEKKFNYSLTSESEVLEEQAWKNSPSPFKMIVKLGGVYTFSRGNIVHVPGTTHLLTYCKN